MKPALLIILLFIAKLAIATENSDIGKEISDFFRGIPDKASGITKCKFGNRAAMVYAPLRKDVTKVAVLVVGPNKESEYFYFSPSSTKFVEKICLNGQEGNYKISIYTKLKNGAHGLNREYYRKLYPKNIRSHLGDRLIDINPKVAQRAFEITSHARTVAEQAEMIIEWVSSNIQYDWDSYNKLSHTGSDFLPSTKINDQSATAVLERGTGMCGGQTDLTVYMLAALGIPSQSATGQAKGPNGCENHAWEKVYLGGKWYSADTTWGIGLQPGDLHTDEGCGSIR